MLRFYNKIKGTRTGLITGDQFPKYVETSELNLARVVYRHCERVKYSRREPPSGHLDSKLLKRENIFKFFLKDILIQTF